MAFRDYNQNSMNEGQVRMTCSSAVYRCISFWLTLRIFCALIMANSKLTNSSSSSPCRVVLSLAIFSEGTVYSSSGEVACTIRDRSDDRRLYDPSGTASFFSNALSSCSFVREEKKPREAISKRIGEMRRGLFSQRLWLYQKFTTFSMQCFLFLLTRQRMCLR